LPRMRTLHINLSALYPERGANATHRANSVRSVDGRAPARRRTPRLTRRRRRLRPPRAPPSCRR
jgi:hypothetical protein